MKRYIAFVLTVAMISLLIVSQSLVGLIKPTLSNAAGTDIVILVAGNNAPDSIKAQAKYVATGTDDGAVLQLAVNELSPTGGTIKIAGTLKYSTANTVIQTSDITIEGLTNNATVDLSGSTREAIKVTATNADVYRVKIKNLRFVSSAQQGSLAVYLVGQLGAGKKVYDSSVEYNFFETPRGAVYFTATVRSNFSHNIVVQNLDIPTDGFGAAYGSDTTVAYNIFRNIGEDAVSCYDNPRMFVSHNEIYDVIDDGIELIQHNLGIGCPDSIIDSNYISGAKGTWDYAAIALNSSNRSIVSNNRISDSGGSASGILLYRTIFNVVNGNLITNTARNGIELDQAGASIITSNIVLNSSMRAVNGYSGVRIQGGGVGDASQNIVANNYINGANHLYEIEEIQGSCGANYNIYHDNQLGSSKVNITGKNSKAYNNIWQ